MGLWCSWCAHVPEEHGARVRFSRVLPNFESMRYRMSFRAEIDEEREKQDYINKLREVVKTVSKEVGLKIIEDYESDEWGDPRRFQ